MKITREQLKHIVREVMTEESEYQTFFKKALEKTGKSIPQMSDEEKKAFFNKIDTAWKGKGEKNERFGRGHQGPTFGSADEQVDELTAAQEKLPPALKKAIEKKEKNESVNEAKNDDKYVVIAFHEKGGGFVMTRPSSKKVATDSARSITKSSDITKQKAVKVSDARKISGLVGKEYLNESNND